MSRAPRAQIRSLRAKTCGLLIPLSQLGDPGQDAYALYSRPPSFAGCEDGSRAAMPRKPAAAAREAVIEAANSLIEKIVRRRFTVANLAECTHDLDCLTSAMALHRSKSTFVRCS